MIGRRSIQGNGGARRSICRSRRAVRRRLVDDAIVIVEADVAARAGAEAPKYQVLVTARLKSCPDTRLTWHKTHVASRKTYVTQDACREGMSLRVAACTPVVIGRTLNEILASVSDICCRPREPQLSASVEMTVLARSDVSGWSDCGAPETVKSKSRCPQCSPW
jgi:hypothetical protein